MKLLTKLKDMPQGVKASIALFLASLISKGISYLITPIYVRLLTPEEYGQVSVYMTWLEVFGIIAMFCLSYGVFNNGMTDFPEKRDEFSFSLLILSNIITICFSAILLALYPLISSILKMDIPLLILMIAVFLFQPAYNFWVTKNRYELKYKATFIVSIIAAVCSPLIAVLLLVFYKDGNALYERIFGAESVLLLIYIFFYVSLWIKNKGKINTKYWKSAFLFNLPLIPHYLSMYLLSGSDKIMISNLVGDAQAAFYSIAHSIAAVALIVWSAVNGSLIPYTYEKFKVKDYDSVSKVTISVLFVFAFACVCVIMLAPEAVKLIATSEYMEAIYVIPPIVGGVFFQVQYHVYSNAVYYYKKPIYVMIGSISATIINLVLNYFGIKRFGYIAAGYTTLISYFIQAVIDYFAMKKVTGQNIYNMKIIGSMSAIVIAISILSSFIYEYAWIRYLIVSLILIGLIIFRKKLISILGILKKKN